MMNNGYHYMHIWLVEALSLMLHKANFSLQQRNIFYLTTKFVEIIEKVPPSQSQLKIIINPAKLIKSNMVMRFI